MEKALRLKVQIHPLVYYQIANAHLLAGNYKQWVKYNKLFLSESSRLKLIPAPKKQQIKEAEENPENPEAPDPEQ